MKDEKLSLNQLQAKDGVIKVIHQTEETEKLFYEKPVNMEGTIKAPGNFIDKRKNELDQTEAVRCNVQYSYQKGYIKLDTVENYSEFGYNITGKLVENPILKEFGINENKIFNVKELLKHLRMNKFLFESGQQHDTILKGLQYFSANINSEIKNINDNRGNIEDLYKTTMKSNVELSFKVKMPVFIGEPEKIFIIEIACEADNSRVNFWLESPDLFVLLEQDKKQIIDTELARFPETFVFIEQ